MKYFGEFMNEYGVSLIHSISIAFIFYVSFEAKRIYKKYIQDKTKKDVVKMVCGAINQLYPNLSGAEKLDKAILISKEILKEKGIEISDLELRMYIESSIHAFKLNAN